MPLLKDVLPRLLEQSAHRNSTAYQLRNERVAAIRLTSGAPCLSHGELFAPWPGKEDNIEEWFELENGQAVGTGVGSDGSYVFPVVTLKPDSR